ncbi:hypothetical protein [Mucilaginibacter sp. PAMB04168]|uniref:hypothetical protein n=1 Tax=Mucilaginibacter sp. PAMB04168 TaxID=3138567 RepID=UPI0031F6E740
MNKFHWLLLSAALYLLSSCTAPRIALTDASWHNTLGYAVEGRTQTVLQKKPLRFGEFYTTSLKTSSKKSSVYTTDLDGRLAQRHQNTLGLLHERSQSSRRFRLSNGRGPEWQVYTFTHLNASSYFVGRNLELNFSWLLKSLGLGNKTENSYYVQVFEPGADRPWELLLDMDAIDLNAKNYMGYFALNDEEYYTIKPVLHVMGKNGPSRIPFGLVGYEISNAEGKAVAAVSAINKGVVYLQDSLMPHERFLMANLCAALLLYEPASIDMEG